jgi:diguanylate cyclase (GGDEF)-like protein
MSKSLTRFYLQPLPLLLLCLALAALGVYLMIGEIHESHHREETAALSRQIAESLGVHVSGQQAQLERIAAQPELIQLLRRGKREERARKADELAKLLPHARDAWLLTQDELATGEAFQSLGPLCVNFLQRLATTQSSPPAEWHALNLPSEHYDLAQPVRDGSRRVGLLFARFSGAPVRAQIAHAQGQLQAYIEMHQARGESLEPVAAWGDPALQSGPAASAAVPHTAWTLSYRADPRPPSYFVGRLFYSLLLILFAIAALLLVHSRLHFQVARAVRHDIKSLARMFEDMRTGTVRVDYPMELREFKKVFKHLRHSGQELVEERERLKDMGLIDHLSQLSNRRHFEARLAELFERVKTHGPSSVLIIDIDHFKAVNDRYGHDAGDALIAGFAAALRKVVRQTDFLARLGGDEFCIIYPHARLDQAGAFVERLRKQLPRELELTHEVVHALRWTGGVSVMTDADTKFDEVLWRADQALLRAKEAGRNTTRLYGPTDGTAPPPRPTWS